MKKETHAAKRRVGRPGASLPRNELLESPPEGRISYIDTLRITLRRSIQPALFDLLVKAGGPPGSNRPLPIIQDYPTPKGLVTLVTFHQPCFTTLELLRRVRDAHPFERVFEFSRLDIALELTANHRTAATQMQDYLLGRLMPKTLRPKAGWTARDADGAVALSTRRQRGGDDASSFTAYLGTSSHRGQVVTVYSNKPSKTRANKRCARVEWRFWGAAEIARARLSEIDDLTQLDHLAFWDKRLCLLRPNEQAGKRGEIRLRQISHKWMLPSRENALWDDTWAVLRKSGRPMISAIKLKKCRLPLLGDAASGLL